MRIIERYFFSRFFLNLIWCLITFVFFYMMTDFFGRLDEIIEGKVSPGTIGSYYLSLMPLVFVRMCPIAVLLATMYTVGNFSRNNEITAVVSGGINPQRILIPFLVTALIISLSSIAVNEFKVPETAQKAYYIKQVKIRGEVKQHLWQNRILYGSNNRKFFLKFLDATTNTARVIEITEYAASGLEKSKFQAREGAWANGEWTFLNTRLRQFHPEGTEKRTLYAEKVVTGEKGWVFFNAGDEPSKTTDRINLPLDPVIERPEDFTKKQFQPEEMSFLRLRREIENLKRMGFDPRRELIRLHMKLSFPFATLFLVVTGIPFAIKQRKGGILIGFGNALGLSLVYYGITSAGEMLGLTLLPAFGAAWMANIIFLCIAFFTFPKIKYL